MIYVLGYKGKSLISRIIRWQTRSEYSHVSIEIDGENYEAWKDGVISRKWDQGHAAGTEVVVFEPQGEIVEGLILKALKYQLGKKYDYKSVIRFLSRRKAQLDDRWFCSELVAWSLAYGGLILQNMPCSYLSPRDICMSPMLKKIETRIIKDE